jgi:hypothetical protein
MTKKLVAILFLCFSGLIFLFALWFLFQSNSHPRQYTQPPDLSIVPKTIDFGRVYQGVEQGRAEVVNNSEKSIDIKSVIRGCDCTDVNILKGVLRPKEQRELSFNWNTHGRRGENEVIISVNYSIEGDITNRIASLMIRATVIPDFEISPNTFDFYSDRENSCQLFLTPTQNKEVCIKEIFIGHPAFSSTISPDAKSVTVYFNPKKWTDDIVTFNARLTTTSENEPYFFIPTNIHVVNSHNK